jgi:hypothetical protein
MAIVHILGEAVSVLKNTIRASRWYTSAIVPVSVVLFLSLSIGPLYAASPTIVIYRVGDTGQNEATTIKQSLETLGYPVVLVQGESVLEKHVDKVSAINRIPAGLFLAFEFVPSEKRRRVLVVKTVARKGEGIFLTIDEVPAKFTEESNRLAYSVAESFSVKVKQMPLFPLLGVTTPGILVKWEAKEEEVPELTNRLCAGLDKYMRKDRNP